MIDLHLHLDGSLSPKNIIKLAKMQNIKLPTNNKKDLKKILTVSKDCNSLDDYLKCFALPLKVLQTREAIEESVFMLLSELKKQGLIYAEVRFAPELHTAQGLSQQQVIESAIKGLKRSDFKANLILCCMRGNKNQAENLMTVNLAKKYLNKGVCAIDLAGSESLFKTAMFEGLFKRAKELNIPFTIHAGEADGPESVEKAIEFGATRLGHGVRSYEKSQLLDIIKQKNIVLELCPTSNFHTKIFKNIKDYPIRKYIDKGVKITINTDNMTVSNTTLKGEFKFLKKHFNLTKKEKIMLINNSIDSAFISKKEKQELRKVLKSKRCKKYNYSN